MAFDDWKLREDRVLDFWNWLYSSNPTTFNVIQVGVSDNKIIATDHGLSLIAKIGDEIVNCHYGTDLVVHPDFRRRGISDEFRENKKKIFLQQEIKLNYTYAVNPTIVRVHSTRHNTLPFRLSRYLRIEKTRLHLKMKKTKNHWQTFLLFQSLKLINKIRIRLSPSQEKNEDFTIKEIKQFDQRIDEFSRKISEHNKFIIVRDRKYLNWRFSDPRAGNYTIYQAENNEQVQILTLFKHFQESQFIGTGFCCGSPDETIADALPQHVYKPLTEINSKHTLLITDACFGGSIFKTRAAFLDAPLAVNKLYELPSRKAMTSGTLTEVPDQSAFLKYMIDRLDKNGEKYLSSEQLFSSFRIAVINNSNVIPQYGEIRDVGDEGGDFIFILKK